MEDSWLHSAVEVFKENSFTSCVWTNTASSFVPRVNIEQSKAGYLKMVGWLTKFQDDDDEVEDGGIPRQAPQLTRGWGNLTMEYLTKAHAMAKEVPTPSTVSRRRERMLTLICS